jgi:hypothetical protein
VTGLDSSHRVDHGLASESDLPRLRARNGPFYSKKTVTNVGESIARRYSQAVSDIFAITAPLGRQRGPYRRRGLREHKSGGLSSRLTVLPWGSKLKSTLYCRLPVMCGAPSDFDASVG